MFFTNLSGLITHLQNNKPTARENFRYLVALIVANLFWVVDGFFDQDPSVSEDLTDHFWVFFSLSLIGTLIVIKILHGFYRRNGGDAGEFFLERLLALYWVVSFRLTLIIVPLLIPLRFESLFPFTYRLGLTFISVAIAIAAVIYSVISMNRAFSKISATT